MQSTTTLPFSLSDFHFFRIINLQSLLIIFPRCFLAIIGGIYYNNVADGCYYPEANPSSYFASNECPDYLMSSSPWVSSQPQQQEAPPPSHNYFQFLAENGQTSLNPSLSSGYRAMPTQIDTDKVGVVKPLDDMANLSNFSSSEYLDPSKRYRKKIKEGFEALQEFLPRKQRGCKEVILDDVIDYVKRLQFQIKDLSQSKMGCESSSTSYVSHEGCDHIILIRTRSRAIH